ncbi:hypothetical protein WA556_000903 [Blastocystis sp. ATCC 50177/Nand II]
MSIVKDTLTEKRNLIIPGYELPWEETLRFSELVITGFTRSFAQRIPNGERREYLKRMLFSGGVGQLDDRHLHKGQPEKGMLVVKVGDHAYRIGLDGACPTRASVVTCPANSNKCESTLRFTKESRENVRACYWFSRDPGYWKSYENLRLKVMQPGELTVESLEGFSNRGLVVNQAKVFHISGYSTQDKVYLVQSASACLEENALDGRVFQTTVLDGATGFAIVVNMTYATAAEDLKMCYQFSTLTASGDKVEGVFHVYAVSGFDAERTVGSIDSVVAGKTKELFLLGAGFAESDMVAWAESGASCAERSQEGAMHKLADAEAFYAVVSMNTLSAGKEFHLCYKFTNEAWNEYPALALRVKHFAGVNGVSQGNANAFVVSQPKAFYLDDENAVSGYSTQDKVHLVLSGQDCAEASAYVCTADVEARGEEAGHFQFTLNLPEALAGSVYRVCYAFGAEMPVQTSSTVAVKSMPGIVGVLEGTAVDAEQTL